ncbi:asparagine synthetase [glutamine-hydrolyzing] [Hydrogenimonas sp.]|nr:asparagine synthetase [glutamine-hydrolyzing] [Hydrogenimonas sp.]
MCAIFGIVGAYDESAARRAFATLAHRGPDAEGVIAEKGLFLAHRRLGIIDPLPEADQPMSAEGITILLNGEIYNYRELREELGCRFDTKSDTEVALRAFLEWGEEMPGKIRGMYAMALYGEGALHLFRDPFGKKPLYWSRRGDTFIFSSEIGAIRSFFGDIPLSRERICSYLSFQSSVSPSTLYPGIHQLEPGGYLRYENGDVEISVRDQLIVPRRYDLLEAEEVEELIAESVGYRLVSDVPVGALLSGGVDSSLVAAVAQRMMPQPLPTFTVGYEGYRKYDERRFAEKVAEHIGSDHREFVMGVDDFLESADELFEHLDEPLGDPAAIPLWFLSRRVKESGVKVLLSGDGADELFFGYRPYYEMADIERAEDLKYRNWLRNYFRSNYSPNREWEWYKRIFDGSVLFRSSAELFTDLQQNRLLKQNVKDDTSLRWIGGYIERFGKPAGPQWFTYIDFKVQLAEVFLKKLDRVTMAHGLEARSPFLDRKFVTELLSSDAGWRMGESPKWLLKEVAAKYLPSFIVERKKKGFSYPYMEWLHLSGGFETVHRVNRELNLFSGEQISFLMERSKKGRFKHHLYAVWSLCKWLEKDMKL